MSDPEKRLHTLLTDRAIGGLDEAQQAELRHLLVGATIDPSYETAAAAIELSLMAHAEAMPSAVKAAVIEQASLYWGFMIPRRHDQTIGQTFGKTIGQTIGKTIGKTFGGRVPGPGPEVDADGEPPAEPSADDRLLGDAEPELAEVRQTWNDGEGFESIDEAFESGVLESSLTNGRIDRGAKPSAELPHDSRPGSAPGLRRSPPKPEAHEAHEAPEPHEPQADPDPELASHEDLDLRSISQSDLGPAASRAEVVHMPLSESRLARVATYVSAIAALLMLSIALWLFVHRGDPPDPDDLRTQVEAASDKLEWSFTIKQDPAVREGAGGSAVWSSEAQTGVLILHGLESTGSGETQYQLWIVDSKREGPPVDGGVFDVSEDEGELQIPIDAKLMIGEPVAFLITVERPGGVVLSAQARVVMVATAS